MEINRKFKIIINFLSIVAKEAIKILARIIYKIKKKINVIMISQILKNQYNLYQKILVFQRVK